MEPTEDAKQTGSSPAACGDDLISGLCDDLLVRILELVAATDARDAVHTAALSRRWRGLWTRAAAAALRFAVRPEFRSARGEARFVAFVDDVLVQMQPALAEVKRLDISFATRVETQPAPSAVGAVERWIRYAMQHAVTSFLIELRLVRKEEQGYYRSDDEDNSSEGEAICNEEAEAYVIVLDELPRSAKLETMSLALGGAKVRFPATMVFEALRNLTLESIRVEAGSAHLLARLLSPPCCPGLQKLRMCDVRLVEENEMLLEAGALTELSLEDMYARRLQLRTPSLRVLCVEGCYDLTTLTVSALSIQDLTWLRNPSVVHIDADLSCVWSLKLGLASHGYSNDCCTNYTSIYLLQRCTAARCLDVYLHVPMTKGWRCTDVIKERLPRLHHVTSLTLHVRLWGRHSFADGVVSLLSRFDSLTNLGIQLDHDCSNEDDLHSAFFCDHADHWKSDEISFAHLQEANFNGFTGTDCELRFLQAVLASSTNIRKVAVSFNTKCALGSRGDEFQHMLLGSGTWSACHDAYESYEWSPC